MNVGDRVEVRSFNSGSVVKGEIIDVSFMGIAVLVRLDNNDIIMVHKDKVEVLE